jgi:hypothetical protein
MNQVTAATNLESAQDLPAHSETPVGHHTADEDQSSDTNSPERQQLEEDPQIVDIKLTLIDAAELAGRAGVQAVKAGAEMQAAAKDLVGDHAIQRKHGIVVLSVFALLVVIALVMFSVMSIRLQQRINQLDAMLLAVGKRTIAMDESLKLVNNSGEVFQAIAERQDTISRQQVKLDTRVEDLMKAAQSAIQTNAQTIDAQGKENAKRLAAAEANIQSHATALKTHSTKLQASPTAAPRQDPALIRREIEAALQRQQKTVSSAPVAAPPAPVATPATVLTPATAAPAATVKNASPAKAAEALVRYPKLPNQNPVTVAP